MIDSYPRQGIEYVGMVITSDQAFLASGVSVCLIDDSVDSPPSTQSWAAPDVATQDTSTQVTVKILRGPGRPIDPAAGLWRMWARITDAPETPIVKRPSPIAIT